MSLFPGDLQFSRRDDESTDNYNIARRGVGNMVCSSSIKGGHGIRLVGRGFLEEAIVELSLEQRVGGVGGPERAF